MNSMLITSGGVITAETMELTRRAYLRWRFSISWLTIPILARKKMTTGSSKTNPKAISKDVAKLIYSLRVGKAEMVSDEYPRKKRKPNGKTTKKAKPAPRMKKTVAMITKGIT